MKFEKKTTKFLGKWRFQAQFKHSDDTKQIASWFGSRNVGDYQITGDSFYTNELQDIFVLRMQFDRQLKGIKQWVQKP